MMIKREQNRCAEYSDNKKKNQKELVCVHGVGSQMPTAPPPLQSNI